MSEYSWCEHISKNVHTSFKTVHTYGESYWTYSGKPITNSWDICPVAGCHKPRPVENSLREQLADRLYNTYWCTYDSNKELIPNKRSFIDMADVALEFLKGKI